MSDHARRLREATAAVIGFLRAELKGAAADPALPEALASLRLGYLRMENLWAYFAEHPDGLTSGRSDGPASRLHLLRALSARYATQVVLPRCGGCDRAVRLPQMGDDGQRRCAACYARARVEECGLCGRQCRVARRDPQGRSICSACADRDRTRWEPCSTCGKTARVAARGAAGPICNQCLPRRMIVCVCCGQEKPVQSLSPSGPLCGACYARSRRYECSICHRRLAAAPPRGPDGERICDRCWQPPPRPCRVCNEVKVIKNGEASGAGICNQCQRANAPRRECAECGRVRSTHVHLPIGAVCSSCAFRLQHILAPCATCHQQRPSIGRDRQGRRICGPCAGETESWTCPGCGQVRFRFSKGRCINCTARQMLDELLSTSAGQTHPQLGQLATLFDVDNHAHAVISWVTKTKSARTLHRLAQGGDAISHQLLDAEPPGKDLDYLRQLLVFAEVLPARFEAVEGVRKWLTDSLGDADSDTAVLLRRYATWSLLRRARTRRRRHRPVSSKNLRMRITTARQWIEWLQANDTTLTEASQAHIDQWLAEGKQTRYELRDFVRWTQREQICGPLQVPFRPRGQPHQFLNDDHRWATLRRCAHDDSLPLVTRAAGGLVLLFGFSPGRLVRIARSDVTITENTVLLKIGRAPLPLPAPLAALIREQTEAASRVRTQVLLPRPDHPQRWLFPGERPGQHADAGRLAITLQRQLGIHVRPSHNAALSRWAEDLPVPILAEVLDMHPSTAARWSALVQRNWVGYIAERAAESRL